MRTLIIILAILSPVHWTGVEKGDSVVLTAEIDSGWHMTLISVGEEMIGEDYTEYQATFHKDAVPAIRFTACDDEQCLAPEVYQYSPLTCSTEGASCSEASSNLTKSLWAIFLLGLLGGLLAIFTPCVWPIIPMTVSFFLKRSGNRKTDAVLYGLSIVVIYVGLGLLITLLFGASALNSLATNAIVNLFFFALLVVFSLSFFGLFEITLPASWSTKLDNKARQTGGVVSIVLMAFVLVIVSFSCTGPIIGTLLVEAAGKSLMAPAIGMLGFALALACPFALLAFFPEWMQKLPKSGEWMQSFKVTLAFVELALSLKFLSVADMAYGWGILPRWLFIALWVACFAGLGIYLIRKSWLGKALAVISWAFALYLLPGLWGAPVKAIAAFAPPMQMDRQVFYDYEEGLRYAQQVNKPIVVDFTGYGCVNCRKMEQYVLADSAVHAALQDYVYIMLYVDSRMDANQNGIEDGEEYSRLQRELYKSNAQPYFVRLDAEGHPIGEAQAFTIDSEEFLRWLDVQ